MQNQLLSTLSLYFEKKYYKNEDPWNIVFAAKYAKDGDLPERALGLTNLILINNNDLRIDARPLSALLTVRGATFRSICNFEEAIKMANKAINIHLPYNYYPYNLLGGIYYDIGEPEKGDFYFLKAEDLGSPKSNKDDNIKNSFNNATDEIKRRNAEYLLKKAPKRYAWVKKYIQRSLAL